MAEIKRVRMKEWRDGQPSCALSCAGVEGLECRKELKVNALVWEDRSLFFCSEEHAKFCQTMNGRESADTNMERLLSEVAAQRSPNGFPFRADPVAEYVSFITERESVRDTFSELADATVAELVNAWFRGFERVPQMKLSEQVGKLAEYAEATKVTALSDMRREGGRSGGPETMMEIACEARACRKALMIAEDILRQVSDWRKAHAEAYAALANLPKAVK